MYYITVSNGLLEGEHQKKMGSAVWQFMWCLDKITSINEKGEGKVLGGKPIKLSELSGSSDRTNSRNLNKLARLGYIKLVHTPYGISIKVYKAKKIFQKRSDKSGVPKRSDKSGVPLVKSGVPNKIIQLDNTTKTPEVNSGSNKNMKTFNYDTGEYEEENKKTSKRKEVIELANLFDKMASNYFGKKIITPKSYFIVLNAMNTHKIKPKGIEAIYKDWFSNPEIKQENKVKLTWCLGKDNINSFKIKN